MFDFETGYYQKKAHTYCCEDCNYRWEVETELDETEDEEISLDYEDSFDGLFSWVCPMCGSSYVSEI
ncbi:MAG: hypothetical protein AB1797_02355 [bacterium]